MEYTALYRKYRPARLADLVGQEHVAKTLLNALHNGRVAHAYIFTGPRGTGKTSAALIMSRAVNCESPINGEPCGECAACRRIAKGGSLDVMEIDAASNRGINEMRDLRDGIKYLPAQEKRKVYIIDEVHMLTTEAFNALLKTLEEPPEYVMFILATTEPHKVPVTILSRCQRFDFHRIGQQQLYEHLQRLVKLEGRTADDSALKLIARRAEGGLRDAVSLLDQCLVASDGELTLKTISAVLGIVDERFIMAMAEAIAEHDGLRIVKGVELLSAEGRDMRLFLQQLLEYVREQLLQGMSGQKTLLTRQRALQMLRDLVDGDQRLRFSLTPRLTLELALLQAARLEEN
jgi:DNA polymerase-3 subunit gamma/tau